MTIRLPLFLLSSLALLSSTRTSIQAFTPPLQGIGALLFPVRGSVIEGISEADNKRLAMSEASDFFVDAFWTNKVGGGSKQLTNQQRRSLQQSQTAEFNKRYGSRRRVSELLLCRNAQDEIIACAGVEVDNIPKGSLKGPIDCKGPLMSNLAVSKRYRRRGLAEELVKAVEKLVQKDWGYEECYLYVERRNRAAIQLYQKLGYRKIWSDPDAQTLLPTTTGDLLSATTCIVCMKKNLRPNFFQKLFS